MSSDLDANGQWERVALELRACKETQQKAWGDIDNTTLGRYLAGEVSDHELAAVETALEELPELRKLTDLVRDVLSDLGPAVPAPEPVVLSFSPKSAPLPRRRFTAFLRRHASMVAAACLLLTFGLAMPRPGYLSAPQTEEMPAPSGGLASTRLVPLDSAIAPNPELGAVAPVSRPEPSPAVERDVKHVALPLLVKADSDANLHRKNITPRQAAAYNRVALFYSARGDLTRAVPPLQQVHQACQDKLGPDHPTTQKTVRYLAGVYETALNSPSLPTVGAGGLEDVRGKSVSGYSGTRLPAPIPGAPPTVPPPPPPMATYAEAVSTLREQIADRSTQDVQTAVVPVLAQALKTATTELERRNFVKAIAELGPAASNAVPVLMERLKTTSDPREVSMLLDTLNKMGPAARQSIPTLVALSGKCRGHLGGGRPGFSKVKGGGEKESPQKRFTASEGQQLQQVLASLNGPGGRAGIDDQAGCFSVRAVRRSNQTIRKLAQTGQVEILFETVCSGHAALKDCVQDGKGNSRLRAMGNRAIHVVLDRKGSIVEVQVSDALQRAGVTSEKVRKCLLPCLQKGQFDKALDDGIQFVSKVVVRK